MQDAGLPTNVSEQDGYSEGYMQAYGNGNPSPMLKTPSRRQRVQFACTECYRRKQKCNRQIPCQHCIARRVPDQCRTPQQQDNHTDLALRLTQLEQTINARAQETSRRMDMLLQRIGRPGAVNSMKSERRNKRTSSREKMLYHTNPTSSQSNSDTDEMSGNEDEQSTQETIPVMLQAAGTLTTESKVDVAPSQCPRDARDDLELFSVSQVALQSLTQTMFPKHVTRRLIEGFLDTINLYRHPIPKDMVYMAFDSFYESGGAVTLNNITQCGLLATLSSIGALYVSVAHPEYVQELAQNGKFDELESCKLLGKAAQAACSIAQNTDREDIYTVLTYAHLSRLFFVRGRISLSWNSLANCVRVALSLRLHRDGKKLGLTPETTHLRRIVWSLVYSIERTTSLAYGRPLLISDAVCDTRAPTFDGGIEQVPEPLRPLFLDTPAPNLLRINDLRSKLASHIGELVFEVQNVHKTVNYSRILQIHNDFQRFVLEKLPFYFQMRFEGDHLVQNTQCDAHYAYIRFQRYQLWLDINFFVLALHCPFLLRYHCDKRSKYATSYEACLEAVKLNFALRREMLYDDTLPRRYRDSMVGFRWFNTVVIAGFILLKQPCAEDAAWLTESMNEFLAWRHRLQHTLQYSSEGDKESEIVREFLNRANLRDTDTQSRSSLGLSPEERSSKRARVPVSNLKSPPRLDPFSAETQPYEIPREVRSTQGWQQVPQATQHSDPPESQQEIPATFFPPNTTSNFDTMPLQNWTGNEDGSKLNWLFDMPFITPNIALDPQTLMPVWPPTMANDENLQVSSLPTNTGDELFDTQQKLNLW
ncbi:hypothetical protein MPSI1_002094 [Malassezia psittaci]|uniref:Zn(2)-C6 fungal-type domain-containing protein n=1 Tax=Malassezia psittaci TaxID=1821823 RepID=A0AAF0FF08_9BASI|nr:hypothetical protein MPSI1_002094 [Malassezia psittaci]